MSNDLSPEVRQAAYGTETGEVFLVLLTIDHESLADPIRVSSDSVATISGGDTYVAFPFEIHLPPDLADERAQVSLKIDNISGQITEAMRSVQGRPTVELQVVLASDPDTIEVGPITLEIERVSYDAGSMEATLVLDDILQDAYPSAIFNPQEWKGLF